METAAAVQVTPIVDADALYRHYDAQTEPQPCHLALDLEDGELTADYNPEIGGGVPASVWHRRTLWISIPLLTADAANALIEDAKPLAQRILVGATINWDGSNHVGYLNDEAQAAYDQLAEVCDPHTSGRWTEQDTIAEWDAGDWFAEEGSEQTITRLGLTADTTDDDLRAMADSETTDARSSSDAGYVALRGAEEYLRGLREELREAEREELVEVAGQLATLTARRNELIRRQVGWRDSTRSIGERAGLSHVAVQKIADR